MLNKICFTLAFILSGLISFAQTNNSNLPVVDYTEPKDYTLADVKITGVQYLDTKVLLSMSGLTVGQKITIPGDFITKIMDKFWNHGLFSDVKIIASKIEGDKIWLEIQLIERPRLSRLVINGLRKGDVDKLNEKLGIKPGSQVTSNVINTIETIVKKFYREKGFLNATVNIIQTKDTMALNRVFLTAEVDKGKKVKIASVEFIDNNQFTDKRLRRVLKKTKQKSINIFRASKFIEKEYKEDQSKLVDFYTKNGYRDYSLVHDSMVVISNKRIAIYLKVHEGNQYHIRSIKWVGNTKYPDEILDKVLKMKKGDVYDQVSLEKRLSSDEDAVSSLYLDNGYLFFQLVPVEAKIEGDSIDLEMHIAEGTQATIKNIIIAGNTKTNEHVIRRELDTYPGDLFSKSNIISSVRKLAQLGHFDPEKISPEPLPNVSDNTVDIAYKLEEKPNDQLEVSGGWGAGMLIGTLGIKFSNFSVRNLFNLHEWRPVPSGDGQTLSLRVQSNGTYYKAYSMSFTEPWFGGKKPNSFSFSLYRTVQSPARTTLLQTSAQNFKVTGGSVGLGHRLHWPDPNFFINNELAYENYKLNNWSGYFTFSNGTSRNLSFKTTLMRNTVDQPIYPRGGSSFSVSLQITPPYSLFRKENYWLLDPYQRANLSEAEIYQKEQANRYAWIEYHKWTFRAQWYNTLYKNLVLYFNTQFGYLGFFNRALGYSPFGGYTLGGDGFSGYNFYGKETIGLRGYKNETVTPQTQSYYYTAAGERQVSTAAVANIYTKITMELRYPVIMEQSATIYGLAFLEAGNSWYNFENYNPFTLRRSAGVGVRAFLPMFGLLGVDWGYGFDPIPGLSESKGQFHFVIGQQF
jgi:outer membrane protein insertion porin family